LTSFGSAWEIIVVDDGSTDGTSQLMEEWVSRPGFRYLQLSRNFGKEAALSAGLAAAAGDVVVCLDADLQHPPSLIPKMLELWREGADMVCAVRANRDDESRIKRYGARLLYFILGSGNRVRIPADAGDFRLLDRVVVTALLRLPERTRFMKGLFAWVGFAVKSIEYAPSERLQGKTHFGFLRLVEFALDGITAFSTWPLRFLTFSGFSIAALAFAYGFYLVVEYLLVGNQVSGWTTIVTAMLFLSGVHLLGLGVLGAYLAQVFNEVKQRPVYLVRQDIGHGLSQDQTDGRQP
jgi:glycosyltransferase involved in cell wall biosynthesis